MGITINTGEQEDADDQVKHSRGVVTRFYEVYADYRQSGYDEAAAIRLALGDQEGLSGAGCQPEGSSSKPVGREAYLARLQNLKRLGPGQGFRTKSGARVRSKAEKIIADFLFDHGIRFEYEPILGLGGFYVLPDFHLLDYGVYLEHFGMDSPEYKRSAGAKLARYHRFGLPLVCTYSTDESDIEDVLSRKLREVGVPVNGTSDSQALGDAWIARVLKMGVFAESWSRHRAEVANPAFHLPLSSATSLSLEENITPHQVGPFP
jgi:hypothetical protein